MRFETESDSLTLDNCIRQQSKDIPEQTVIPDYFNYVGHDEGNLGLGSLFDNILPIENSVSTEQSAYDSTPDILSV